MEKNPWKTLEKTKYGYVAKDDIDAIEAVFKKSPEKAKKTTVRLFASALYGKPGTSENIFAQWQS